MDHVIDLTNMWLVAGIWMLLAAISSFIAIRVKMPAALVEIVIGMLAGNFILLRTNAWIDFVAGFGSILSRSSPARNRSRRASKATIALLR